MRNGSLKICFLVLFLALTTVMLHLVTACNSTAQKSEPVVYSDSFKVNTPYAIGESEEEIFLYSPQEEGNNICIRKLRLEPNKHLATEVGSIRIENAYLRYLDADKKGHIYLSVMPKAENKPVVLNKESIPIERESGLNIIYVLQSKDFSIIDSITYLGNNLELSKSNSIRGITFTTSDGIGILNKLGYAPRSNQFDGYNMEGDSALYYSLEGENLYYLYYKSGSEGTFLPIPKDIVDDYSSPSPDKKYTALSNATPIRFLRDDKENIYFSFNLEVQNVNKESPDSKNNQQIPRIEKGEHRLCQLFSINKRTGAITKYFKFEYRIPVKVYQVHDVIYHDPAVNLQQLKLVQSGFIFSISGIMDSKELETNKDSVFTSIIKMDTVQKSIKTLNIPYLTEQLINIYTLTDADLVSVERINDKSYCKGFDYFTGRKIIHIDSSYTLYGEIDKHADKLGSVVIYFK